MMNAPTQNAKKEENLVILCKIFSNPMRLRIIRLLEKKPYTFTELTKELVVNPKVLDDSLTLMTEAKMLVKSYPYGVYALTAMGRAVKNWLDSVDGYLNKVGGM